jgi:hypothetical protein
VRVKEGQSGRKSETEGEKERARERGGSEGATEKETGGREIVEV